jgi:hypothetical protein
MFYRFFNKGGHWTKPATMNPKDWKTFTFDINWENLNKMVSLRSYYIDIAPPFSQESAPRVGELEQLYDDIAYYHVRRSWGHFIVWVIFTSFFVDLDAMDRPRRHPMADDKNAHDFPRIREGHLGDDT